jgi:hypothetical protein
MPSTEKPELPLSRKKQIENMEKERKGLTASI